MSILVIGSVALDTIKTPFGEAKETLGGSATYFSYAASFFSPVRLVAVVGEDFPEEAFKLLQNKEISLEGLEISTGKTFRWTGSYENDMNAAQTHKTELNVFQNFTPKIPAHFENTPHVFLANIDPDLQMDVLDRIKAPQLIGCDTMNLWIHTKKERLLKLLKRVHILFINDAEARQMTGVSNLIKAGKELLKEGPRVVVIKKGEHGAMLITSNFFFAAPAFPVQDVFDPTGAGDCFAGGFFSSLAASGHHFDEDNLRRAVIYGTIMASFNVESFSLAGLTHLTSEDISRRVADFKKFTHFDPAAPKAVVPNQLSTPPAELPPIFDK